MQLELGAGRQPTPGYIHHDKRRHSPDIDVAHDLDVLPWPWEDNSCDEILAQDVFEHLQIMPEAWMKECHRMLKPDKVLRLRVPIFGSSWHLWDPTHVRGFHPANFQYFVRGHEHWRKYGCYYFDFAFSSAVIEIEHFNIVAALTK